MCFFSSRRRHTRFDCDWSSDVCSSDLNRAEHASVIYIKSTVVGMVTLLLATIVYIIFAGYLALRNSAPPPGTEVSFAVGSILNRPSYWVIGLAAFALGFYWKFRRA